MIPDAHSIAEEALDLCHGRSLTPDMYIKKWVKLTFEGEESGVDFGVQPAQNTYQTGPKHVTDGGGNSQRLKLPVLCVTTSTSQRFEENQA